MNPGSEVFTPNMPMVLLSAHAAISTKVADAAQTQTGDVMPLHHLKAMDPRKKLEVRHHCVSLCRTSVHVLRYGTEVLIESEARRDHHLVLIPLAGSAMLFGPGGEQHVDEEAIGVLTASASLRMKWSADCEMVLLKVPSEAMQNLWRGLEPLITVRWQSEPDIATWRQSVFDLVANLGPFGPNTPHHPLACETSEERMLVRFAALFSGPSDGLAGSGDSKTLNRAREMVLAHLNRALTVSEIAEHACVCPRTLELVFKRNGLPSPMAWARQQRLHQVRSELLRAAQMRTPVNITRTAMSYGFNHMGRFAAQYKYVYGTSPSVTMTDHRAGSRTNGDPP